VINGLQHVYEKWVERCMTCLPVTCLKMFSVIIVVVVFVVIITFVIIIVIVTVAIVFTVNISY
jgi:uncharacterized membrane protein